MKAPLLALFVALLMVGCGESSNPSESAEMNHTAPKKDATETAVDIVDGRKLEKHNGVAYLPNEETPFTGRAVGFFENGQKRYEKNYKDGKPDGLSTYWHDNGQKALEGSNKEGKNHGLLTYWYENGQKEWVANYKDGKRDGVLTSWYENGQKESLRNWKDGKTMSVKAWKPNGEKCPVTNVKDGSGVVVVYNEGGTESGRQTFKDGELVFD